MSRRLFRAEAVSAYRRGQIRGSTLRYSSPLARWSGFLLVFALVVGAVLAATVRVPTYVVGDGLVAPGPSGTQAVVAFPAELSGALGRGSQVEFRAGASDPITVTLLDAVGGLTTADVLQRFGFTPAGDPGAGGWLVGVGPVPAAGVPVLAGQEVRARVRVGTRTVIAVFDGRGVVVWQP